jgi:CubicO group peptidase (beta-lactamase class C family)
MLRLLFCSSLLALVLLPASSRAQSRLPIVPPAEAGMSASKLAGIDGVVEEAIKAGQLPGAVVLVLREGKIVWRKAYGNRRQQPARQAMTVDTVFDLASLTKPIVTATSIMLLLEQGKLQVKDPLYRHLPQFKEGKQRQVTIEHLLLHTSGLVPDNSLRDYQSGKDEAMRRLLQLQPRTIPGERFRYSDVGFMLLGIIVENVSGERLDVFARKHIFQALGMKDTTYNPGKDLVARSAPTEKRQGKWLQGEVHDPRAHLLGGVAGHAGLFSSADDLAVFCQMLLDGGQLQGKRILAPATVRLLTSPRKVPGGLRSLGWDVDTRYSSNRGQLFSTDGFGHTGFTGTSIWVDRPSRTAVIFLSNRVHPDGKGNVIRLRHQVATIVASSLQAPARK